MRRQVVLQELPPADRTFSPLTFNPMSVKATHFLRFVAAKASANGTLMSPVPKSVEALTILTIEAIAAMFIDDILVKSLFTAITETQLAHTQMSFNVVHGYFLSTTKTNPFLTEIWMSMLSFIDLRREGSAAELAAFPVTAFAMSCNSGLFKGLATPPAPHLGAGAHVVVELARFYCFTAF